MKTIYLAGGCFWGTEKVFKSLRGVTDTTVGYANGHTLNPTYRQVCTDTTGHRETVKVVYDPETISLQNILRVFFLVIDPELQNRQGEDVGSQYQTGVYYEAPEDLPLIQEVFAAEQAKHPVFFVELLPLSCFYDGEDYHQDYLDKNPSGYCHITPHEMAEVAELAKTFQ